MVKCQIIFIPAAGCPKDILDIDRHIPRWLFKMTSKNTFYIRRKLREIFESVLIFYKY